DLEDVGGLAAQHLLHVREGHGAAVGKGATGEGAGAGARQAPDVGAVVGPEEVGAGAAIYRGRRVLHADDVDGVVAAQAADGVPAAMGQEHVGLVVAGERVVVGRAVDVLDVEHAARRGRGAGGSVGQRHGDPRRVQRIVERVDIRGQAAAAVHEAGN